MNFTLPQLANLSEEAKGLFQRDCLETIRLNCYKQKFTIEDIQRSVYRWIAVAREAFRQQANNIVLRANGQYQDTDSLTRANHHRLWHDYQTLCEVKQAEDVLVEEHA